MGVSSLVWRGGRVAESDVDLDRLDQLLADPSALVWLDVCMAGEPDADVLAQLAGELSFSSHQVEDAVAPGERPKVTRHGDHTFVTVYGANLGPELGRHESRLVTTRISAFVLPTALVTVRRDGGFAMEQVVERWEDDPALVGAGVGGLLHGLLDVVVDQHFDTIQQVDDAVEELEDLLFADVPHRGEVQRDSYRLRKELVELRRVVLPMREVVAALMRPSERMVQQDEVLRGYYEDLYDHVLRAGEWTESLRDMISSVFDTNLSLQDARLNTVMKKLAGWAAVIAVPTAVTGWFGQNVPYPGFSTSFGFWQSVVAMVVGTGGLYLLLRSKDWI